MNKEPTDPIYTEWVKRGNKEVVVFQSDERGTSEWVVAIATHTDYWLYACEFRSKAEDFCDEHMYKITNPMGCIK